MFSSDFVLCHVFSAFLVFCRIGTAMMFFPLLSAQYVPARIKLFVACAVSFITYSSLGEMLLTSYAGLTAINVVLILVEEFVIGLCIGAIIECIFSAVHIAGFIMGYQMGLSAGMLLDPGHNTQNAQIGILLSLIMNIVLISMDLHLPLFRGLAESYNTFPSGTLYQHYGDLGQLVLNISSQAWDTALKIAAPVLIVSVVMSLGGGILARLMPQMQVFFLMLPVQIVLSVLTLIFALAGITMWFMAYYQDSIGKLFHF